MQDKFGTKRHRIPIIVLFCNTEFRYLGENFSYEKICLFYQHHFTFGCLFLRKKKDEIIVPEELPKWVKQRVEELTVNGESCNFVDVSIYEIKGKLYYNIDFGYSSCGMCNVFDEKGNRVSQDEKATWNEFKFIDWRPACK